MSKERSGASGTYLSHFPTESDAFTFTFDGQGCATVTVELTAQTPVSESSLLSGADVFVMSSTQNFKYAKAKESC